MAGTTGVYAEVADDLRVFLKQVINEFLPQTRENNLHKAQHFAGRVALEQQVELRNLFSQQANGQNIAEAVLKLNNDASAAISEVMAQFNKPMPVNSFVAACNAKLPPESKDMEHGHAVIRGILRDLPRLVINRDVTELEAMQLELRAQEGLQADVPVRHAHTTGMAATPA